MATEGKRQGFLVLYLESPRMYEVVYVCRLLGVIVQLDKHPPLAGLGRYLHGSLTRSRLTTDNFILAQQLFQPDGLVGFFVAIFDDDGRVERNSQVFAAAFGYGARTGNHHGAWWNHEWLGFFPRRTNFTTINRVANQIVDRSRASENRSRGEHRAVAHDGAFVHAAIAAHQNFVLDNHGQRADGFEHAADLRRGRDVTFFPHLRARADQRVRVNHGAIGNISAHIHIHGRHADYILADVTAVANRRPAGDHAHVLAGRDLLEWKSMLVPKLVIVPSSAGLQPGILRSGCRRYPDRHLNNPSNAKPQQDPFLHPGVYFPSAPRTRVTLRRSHAAFIQCSLEFVERMK